MITVDRTVHAQRYEQSEASFEYRNFVQTLVIQKGVVEDAVIDEIVRSQTAEVIKATEMLQTLVDTPVKDRPSFLNESMGAFRSKKVPSNKLSFQHVLKLLMESASGNFAENVPKQKCASPVPLCSASKAFQPVFYVSKEKKLSKMDENIDGIPVRYQGFTKATIWWSDENPQWGLVARRMQHQSRMKHKKGREVEDDEVIASKAALFFQVFEGTSYVLIKRENPSEEVDRSRLGSYVIESASKIVQIWPLQKPSRKQLICNISCNSSVASSIDENICKRQKCDSAEFTLKDEQMVAPSCFGPCENFNDDIEEENELFQFGDTLFGSSELTGQFDDENDLFFQELLFDSIASSFTCVESNGNEH